ncbi:SRPBCC family protein [Arthrobacter tecti]
MTSPYFIRRERFIAAPASAIFEVLATPALHSVIDGSGTVTGEQPNGPERLSKGAKFGMDMKIGAPYKILNTVVEFEEDRRIAWRHFSRHVWRYTLEQNDGGTTVTEEWDATEVPWKPILKVLGFTRKHPASIERTLEKLDEYVTKR